MSGRRSSFIEFSGVNLERLSILAKELHRRLPPRVVVGLRGTLGAGKTRLAQAIAQAAGVDVSDVTSPTFTIVQHYHADRLIHHIDAYRLADEDEFFELGGEELLDDDAMILIEWPERIARSLPPGCLNVEIDIEDAGPIGVAGPASESTRRIRFSSDDEGLMVIVREISAMLSEA